MSFEAQLFCAIVFNSVASNCMVFSVSGLLEYIFMQQVCAWHPWWSEETARSPGAGAIHGCELLCELWETNLVSP